MGILSFIKKIFSEPEEKEPTIREKISFSNIENVIKKKINEANAKENEEFLIIKENIRRFTGELKEKIKIVNEVDIESKEKNDKVKSAVYEGRKKYIEFLERFIEILESLEYTNLEKFTEDINLAFTRFNENSNKSYERATILIGKEMGSIRETLKKFSNELIDIFKTDKEIILTSRRLSLIQSKYNDIKKIDEESIKINEEITNIKNKINDKEEENKEISHKIEEIKDSPEYLNNLEKKKNIQINEKEIEKGISELRQLIDFKALSNFFHIFEDRMTIVKLYRDDFLVEFKKDMGSRLLNLLNESKLNNEKIYDSIKQLQDKEQEIENGKKDIKGDEIQDISLEFEKTKEDINNLIKEREWVEKKKEKLKTTQEEALNIIKQELGLINLDLDD
jgi:hypothetical protein